MLSCHRNHDCHFSKKGKCGAAVATATSGKRGRRKKEKFLPAFPQNFPSPGDLWRGKTPPPKPRLWRQSWEPHKILAGERPRYCRRAAVVLQASSPAPHKMGARIAKKLWGEEERERVSSLVSTPSNPSSFSCSITKQTRSHFHLLDLRKLSNETRQRKEEEASSSVDVVSLVETEGRKEGIS